MPEGREGVVIVFGAETPVVWVCGKVDRTQCHPSAEREPQATALGSDDMQPSPVPGKHFVLGH